ncbi:MAG: SIR2 family protein, partial [Tannerella sp.]|nr:SIR2 family protein [Tannerella sp.]
MKTNYKKLNQKQLVQLFGDYHRLTTDSSPFCFLLGAGASVSSGIPTGWDLSKRWYKEIKDVQDEPEDWMKEITDRNVGEYYTLLYEKRFCAKPELGYDEFKTLMEGKEPGLAYAILVQILTKEVHRFVITTNFDYLVEDAIRMYTSQKPFIAGHETLAGFISLRSRNPTVIKIHRDLLLHPMNTAKETAELKEEWKKALAPLLKQFHLLVIGYGGNDGSLMGYLEEMKNERLPLYWCILQGSDLNPKIEKLLTEDDKIVEIENFDSLMFALQNELNFDIFRDLDKPNVHPFVEAAKTRIVNLDNERTKLASQWKENKMTAETVPDTVKNIFSGGVSKILLDASQEKDNRKKEEIYQNGLKAYPENAYLLEDYAEFLYDIGRTKEGAEKYQQTVTIKPDKQEAYYNWGTYLGNLAQTKTGDEAEALYREAFEKYQQAVTIKPDCHEAYYNWGIDLGKLAQTKTGDEADALYREAF